MITAKTLFVPAVGISAVTATPNIRLKPHTVTLVVSFVEAVLANDASLVFFAVLAFPSYVSRLQRFGTDPHSLKTARELSDDVSIVNVSV